MENINTKTNKNEIILILYLILILTPNATTKNDLTSSSRLRFIVLSLREGSARLMVVDCVVVVVEEVIVDAGGCKTPTRLADDGTA